SKISRQYWSNIVKVSTLKLNQIPSHQSNKSSYELFKGKTLPLDFFHPIGNPVSFLNEPKTCSLIKFLPKTGELWRQRVCSSWTFNQSKLLKSTKKTKSLLKSFKKNILLSQVFQQPKNKNLSIKMKKELNSSKNSILMMKSMEMRLRKFLMMSLMTVMMRKNSKNQTYQVLSSDLRPFNLQKGIF
ncbi:hypothetical protein VP01_4961g1, partial [Puccinia sorghi]